MLAPGRAQVNRMTDVEANVSADTVRSSVTSVESTASRPARSRASSRVRLLPATVSLLVFWGSSSVSHEAFFAFRGSDPTRPSC